MKLTFYAIQADAATPRPSPSTRPWMDETFQAFAYRCLPLNIANSHGWEFPCPSAFSARWNGGATVSDIDIRSAAEAHLQPASIFGHGIITFHIHGLFRTEPGWNLFAGGPPNSPKDGIYPLSGIIETDWAPYTFTMNWRFTRPDHWVSFDEGEPICFVFPVQRGVLDTVTPELRLLADEPELKAEHDNWSRERAAFSDGVHVRGSAEERERWQKRYYRGIDMRDRQGVDDHQAKLRLAGFVDRRPAAALAAARPSRLPAFFKSVTTLSPVKHAKLGFVAEDYRFAANSYLIPVTAGELPAASRHYPIVFSANDPARPLCVVGTRAGINLFVDADGRWRPGCYIPAALRRYPFITVANPDDPKAWTIGIDETSARLSPEAPQKLFEASGTLTRQCQAQVEFCATLAAAFEQTDELGATLSREDLLMPSRNTAPARIAGRNSFGPLRTIDPQRLAALAESIRAAWQASGWLPALEAQIASAKNWGALLALEESATTNPLPSG